jgi:trimethylamine:corrinoid methyltransferase-like protein
MLRISRACNKTQAALAQRKYRQSDDPVNESLEDLVGRHLHTNPGV